MIQVLITGFIIGLLVGFLVKKLSKAVIFFILLLFVFSQFMAFQGYISLDIADLGSKAVQSASEIETDNIERLFTQNIPFSLAAVAGFLFGFKRG